MGQRTAAFLAAAFGGGIELFGALYGQGVLGHGLLFGLVGSDTRPEAAMLGFAIGSATIVAGVGLMLVRDPRRLAAIVAVMAVVGTLAAGQMFAYGAALSLMGAVVATRIDRTAPLY
ncbi:MAG: hypothetical protein A2V84_10330 [Chloroflexi bacterium RBG_16_70_13]|nr:MAG: hypothetical protein A2V84_10330 [Chloroflexi bacterium RBG_16_70_13]